MLLPLYESAKKRSRARQHFVSHRVLSLEFELVNGQSFGVLQLLNLIHLLVVESDLLVDDHLYTPRGEGKCQTGCVQIKVITFN